MIPSIMNKRAVSKVCFPQVRKMKLIRKPLSAQEIFVLKKQHGSYLKLTIDLENEILVAGCELHADGEEILLKKGGRTENIWGGGINLETKTIDATAVINLRSSLGNESMEILASKRREKFFSIVKKLFVNLWD